MSTQSSVRTLIPLGEGREGAPKEEQPKFASASEYRYQNFATQDEQVSITFFNCASIGPSNFDFEYRMLMMIDKEEW